MMVHEFSFSTASVDLILNRVRLCFLLGKTHDQTDLKF